MQKINVICLDKQISLLIILLRTDKGASVVHLSPQRYEERWEYRGLLVSGLLVVNFTADRTEETIVTQTQNKCTFVFQSAVLLTSVYYIIFF